MFFRCGPSFVPQYSFLEYVTAANWVSFYFNVLAPLAEVLLRGTHSCVFNGISSSNASTGQADCLWRSVVLSGVGHFDFAKRAQFLVY